jgi:vanillate O-demethylase ferredoxin subunit
MKKAILIAGGIGVTPLKAMAHRLESQNIAYELHYCAKDAACAAFGDAFDALAGTGRVYFHFDGGDPGQGLDIQALLRQPEPQTHVYYCGPGGFMDACARATGHWPDGTVHCEHFKPPLDTSGSGDKTLAAPGSFSVRIASTGQTFTVPAEQTLADALLSAGVGIETSCVSGLCGTCRLRYLSGEVEHQDFILSDAEHQQFLTACVSRGKSGVLVLDL